MSATVLQKVNDFFITYPMRVFDKRRLMLRPEEPLPGIFYITEGLVSQYDIAPNGSEVAVNVFKPGAFFPMSAALNHTLNLYFFEASTVVKAHVAPPDAAVQFLKDNPDVALDLLSRVYRGADGVLRRMAHLMGGNARHRLLFELINAAYRFGEPQQDGSILLPLREGDLARHSGLARETVNRNLQLLKTTGILVVAPKGLLVINVRELEALLSNNL